MKAFLLFTVLLWSLESIAQSSAVKLYGYAQPVIGGVPASIQKDEQGNSIEPSKNLRTNYLIYLAYPKKYVIYPIELWLKGKAYTINAEPVETPVEILFDNGDFAPEKMRLVPYTEDTCFKLTMTDKPPAKNAAIKKSLIESNDLVLIYRMNGKNYWQLLKKIKGLRAMALP